MQWKSFYGGGFPLYSMSSPQLLNGKKLILHLWLSIDEGSYQLTSNKLTHITNVVLSLTTTINLITRFILPFLLYLLHVSTNNVLFTSSSSNSSSYKDIFLSSLSQGWLPSLITKDFLYQWLNLINISTTTWSLGGLFLHVDILLFNAIPCCKIFHSNTFL